MKLFLPALLFFVLGTTTSALAGTEWSVQSMSVRINYEGELHHGRAEGHWQSVTQRDDQIPVVARIGPDKNDLMEIEYYDDADLKAVCNGKYPFVRILSEGAYPKVAHYDSSKAFFPPIIKDHMDDITTILLDTDNKQVTMKLKKKDKSNKKKKKLQKQR